MPDDELYSTVALPIIRYFKANSLKHQGPPMLYKSFRELDQSRLPSVVESLTSSDVFCETRTSGLRVNTHITKEQEHNADVMLGLLYYMVGGTDEAHDLVLPYSLPCDTDWGGPAILDSPALGNATYCHALVHRTEGRYIGELDMIGWDNAKSWFSETPQNHIMFDKVSEVTENLGNEASLDLSEQRICDQVKGSGSWSWSKIIDMFSTPRQTEGLMGFCDNLHNTEVLMLFDHCNKIVNNR